MITKVLDVGLNIVQEWLAKTIKARWKRVMGCREICALFS